VLAQLLQQRPLKQRRQTSKQFALRKKPTSPLQSMLVLLRNSARLAQL
jgi:hypothetical protein